MGRHKKERIDAPDRESCSIMSRKALKNTDFTFWGTEPDIPNLLLTESELKEELGRAFSWYNVMVDEDQKMKFLLTYIEAKCPQFLKPLRKVNIKLLESGLGHVTSILARFSSRGIPLPKEWREKLTAGINSLSRTVAKEEKETPVFTKHRELKERAALAYVEVTLDKYGLSTLTPFPTSSMADTILKVGLTNAQRLRVQAEFTKRIEELETALEGKDSYINESYRGFSKKNIQKVLDWMTGDPTPELVQVAKKIRKPRTKKKKTTAQILKHFTCKVSDSDLNIKSIDPSDILGASQLWVYDTEKRKIGTFNAKTDAGLSVYRRSIADYDEETSVMKTVRKPAEFIPQAMAAGKVALRHILEEIRAVESPIKCRINENVLLLKVIK